jgi:hypothetical protein
MTDAALECLKQDDLRMFYKGACHVFAVALQRYRSLEQYELCRVLCRGLGAYHVYARTGDWLVDVGGLKREADYFHWLQRRANEHGCDFSNQIRSSFRNRTASTGQNRRGARNR